MCDLVKSLLTCLCPQPKRKPVGRVMWRHENTPRAVGMRYDIYSKRHLRFSKLVKIKGWRCFLSADALIFLNPVSLTFLHRASFQGMQWYWYVRYILIIWSLICLCQGILCCQHQHFLHSVRRAVEFSGMCNLVMSLLIRAIVAPALEIWGREGDHRFFLADIFTNIVYFFKIQKYCTWH